MTFFNDICFMVPASLTSKRIKWLETKGNKDKAAFTNNGTIPSWFNFRNQGAPISFISDDRFVINDHNS